MIPLLHQKVMFDLIRVRSIWDKYLNVKLYYVGMGNNPVKR